MSIEDFNRLTCELSSFADDEYEIVSDYNTGQVMFERGGQMVNITIYEDDEGRKMAQSNGTCMSYGSFLAKEMAHLDILATKILQKSNQEMGNYIDPSASLLQMDKQIEGGATSMLDKECDHDAMVGTKICFVTADAGHGKSMLLHQFQNVQAKKYLQNQAKYLFWHIDLHGRDLVRLNEAIMYELGELRVSGLYYSSIITLIKRHLIVLGIDGFDELAVEKGGESALNSLSSLVTQMNGRGVLVAASRRAFFNSQDYIQRSGILHKNIGAGCVFDELKIQNWRRDQCTQFLERYMYESDIYDNLVHVLGGVNHPLLERPYLFTKLVSYSYEDNISPIKFVTSKKCQLDSINSIIESFIDREVDKWTALDKTTGEPYLSFDQHIQILSEIAKEMWRSQHDYISIEGIQLFASILFEDWKIAADIRPIVLRLLESHAMLVNCDNRDNYRRFDHEEFRNYFVARALENDLRRASANKNYMPIASLLSAAPLSDSVAQYLSTRIAKSEVLPIVQGILTLHQKEWKPTYIQTNIGTILPFLLDNVTHDTLIINNKISFSSLIFENKTLENIVFKDCSLINVSFYKTNLKNVRFEACSFSGLLINETDGKNNFIGCTFDSTCQFTDVTWRNGEDEYKEYAPEAIFFRLYQCGIIKDVSLLKDATKHEEIICNSDFYKIVRRLLNKYTQSTCIYESNIRELPTLNSHNPDLILSEIVPLFEKYNIIVQKETKMSKRAGSKAWVLKDYEISQILRAEYSSENKILSMFWKEVKQHI